MVPALDPPHAPPQAAATAPYAADADRWRAVRANDRAAATFHFGNFQVFRVVRVEL